MGAPELSCSCTTALVTVRATSTDRKAPMRLKTADSATATLGFKAPVTIDVAMAFAVSWNPLVKSNPSAVTTTRNKITRAAVTAQLWPSIEVDG
jgi:hypothetical protein